MPAATPTTPTISLVTAEVEASLAKYADLLDRKPREGWDSEIESAPDQPEETEAPPPLPKNLEPITRPNGELYRPRVLTLGGKGGTKTTDVDFIRRAYAENMPVFLYGPPGTGKTSSLEAALPNLVTITGTSQTESSDFLGSWVARPDGTYTWVDGPLVIAAEEGRPFFIDEIALIDPRELATVYPLADGRGEILITANPARGTVKAADGFCIFGATNPHVPGAVMSDAMLSRFRVHIEYTTDWKLATELGIGAKIITVARNLETKKESGELVAAPQLRELLGFRDTSKAFGQDVAIANFISQARLEDRPVYSDVIKSVFGTTVAPLKF